MERFARIIAATTNESVINRLDSGQHRFAPNNHVIAHAQRGGAGLMRAGAGIDGSRPGGLREERESLTHPDQES